MQTMENPASTDAISIMEAYNSLSQYPRFSTIEKMGTRFFNTAPEACKEVALVIKDLIDKKEKEGKRCVLGLATGSTPVGVYKELIKLYKQGKVSFKNVMTFNLDEYYPISHTHYESYHAFMNRNLFDHIDIDKANTHVPSGEIPRSEVEKFCQEYEQKIVQAGGIDLQILGIGRTGHVGFNEPPSSMNSVTRLVHLERVTRMDNSAGFNGVANVPKHAITMGISTILGAKKIIIMAWSENKASIVQKTIEGQTTNEIPATLLHHHKDVVFYLDRPASAKLSRFVHPWTIRGDIADPQVKFDKYWTQKAVTWLSLKVNKAILKLTYEDYEDNMLSNLVTEVGEGEAEAVNLMVYKWIDSKITGWPLSFYEKHNTFKNISGEIQMAEVNNVGSSPNLDRSPIPNYYRKSSQRINPFTVLIFSPHPDDDVICMGATIQKLIKQGHNVHVAYMTSGSYAVRDVDAKKYLDFFDSLAWECQLDSYPEMRALITEAMANLKDKKEKGTRDGALLRSVKKLIRRAEAKLAVEDLGGVRQNIHPLDLPFYETGESKKNPVTEVDLNIIKNLITKVVNPDIIYAAGDLTDPHGTHRVCLEALLKVVDEIGFSPNNILLYRGAWEEWEIELADFLIPVSPVEVEQKRQSIFRHQSQKDGAMFPGNDKREFWERSEQRNRGTANLLSRLGFTSYEAVECFVTLKDLRKAHSI